ncbi:hypothetical protein KAZ82_00440 [Candidatus Babeliales bacterium]|nr:hypothetical protein [Candidatus Babeliales bacterium]
MVTQFLLACLLWSAGGFQNVAEKPDLCSFRVRVRQTSQIASLIQQNEDNQAADALEERIACLHYKRRKTNNVERILEINKHLEFCNAAQRSLRERIVSLSERHKLISDLGKIDQREQEDL